MVRAAGLAAALLSTLILAGPAAAKPRTDVVVTGKGAARAVAAAGGTVTHRVRLIDGVIAKVPARKVRALRRARGVRSVTRDRAYTTRSRGGDDDGAMLGVSAPATDAVPSEATTIGEVRQTIGADALGTRGAGVDVALIDSGITPVHDLAAPGKVVNGPDFSFDTANPDLGHLDAFGHGTHLAGIVAGVAPGARLVNVKAANAEGITSLTQLLLAIDWTVRYRRANGLDIRVLTLAVGTENDGYQRSPLAVAVERAWNAGIVVVAAAGNDASSGKGLELPAADPFVLAVGGAETQGTGDPADDTIADWSSRGDGERNPDVIAPGSSIVSYRVPGSFIDESSQGRVGDTLQRGSGTSQATAVTAGAAALLLEGHDWTPNQVKAALRGSARPLAGDPRAVGEGALDVSAASAASPADRTQPFRPANARGDRGDRSRRYGMGRRLRDLLGRRWTGRRWTGVKWNGVKWSGVKW